MLVSEILATDADPGIALTVTCPPLQKTDK